MTHLQQLSYFLCSEILVFTSLSPAPCDDMILTFICVVSWAICILEIIGIDVPDEIEQAVRIRSTSIKRNGNHLKKNTCQKSDPRRLPHHLGKKILPRSTA